MTADHLAELVDWDASTVDEHFAAVGRFVLAVGHAAALEASRTWARSDDPATCAAGLDVLGSLAGADPIYVGDLLAAAGQAVGRLEADVRWSAVQALGHPSDERCAPIALRLVDDEDSDVRCLVTSCLAFSAPEKVAGDHPIVGALLQLMADPVADVRDMATLALGVLLDADSPEIRDGLVRRLDDDGGDTAGEAAVGLARRGDPRVFDVLVERLGRPDVGNLYVEAAADLGDPRLLSLLQALDAAGWRDDDPRPHLLDEAIAACGG